jgi:hypothetical protein
MMLQLLKSLLLRYVLIIVCAAAAESVQTVCINPNNRRHLRSNDCVSLESLLKGQAWSPGTTVRFSAGIYSLSNNSTTNSILVRDTSNISLLGDAFGATVIECDGRLGFGFINATNLTIANIQFIQCGAPVNDHKALEMQINLITPGTKAAHFLFNSHRLLMTNVIISHSPGYGLLCVNLHGESHIVKTNFSFNGIDSTSEHERLEGGSIFLLYHEGGTTCMCPAETSWTSISSNVFDTSLTHRHSDKRGSCLLIVIKQTCHFIRVSVGQSVLTNSLVPIVSIHDQNMSVNFEIEMQRLNVTNSVQYTEDSSLTISTIMYISAKDNSINLCLTGNKIRMRDISIYDCVFTDAQSEDETDFGYIDIMLYLYINITIEKCVFLQRITKSAILIRPENTYLGTFIRIDKCLFMGLHYGAVSISYSNQQSLNIKIINSIYLGIFQPQH